jgi:hypothetical protein
MSFWMLSQTLLMLMLSSILALEPVGSYRGCSAFPSHVSNPAWMHVQLLQ